MQTNTKKLTLNAILLSMGLLLHQITPAIGIPIQPDMSLIILFTIMILNKGDYKTILTCGLITGVFCALTTKFPGGQIPNIIDKVVTTNIIFYFMYILYKIPMIKKLSNEKQDLVVNMIILPIGTLISGVTFLIASSILVGLPGEFSQIIMVVVVPAIIINLIFGTILNKVINVSIRKVGYNS